MSSRQHCLPHQRTSVTQHRRPAVRARCPRATRPRQHPRDVVGPRVRFLSQRQRASNVRRPRQFLPMQSPPPHLPRKLTVRPVPALPSHQRAASSETKTLAQWMLSAKKEVKTTRCGSMSSHARLATPRKLWTCALSWRSDAAKTSQRAFWFTPRPLSLKTPRAKRTAF